MSFDLGLCSISFRKNSPEEILIAMKDAGLSVIEWGSDLHCPPEKAEEIAELTKKYGIKCSSYGTYFRLGVTPIKELENYIAAAKILGTNILRLWCSYKNANEHTEEEKDKLFSLCKAAAKIAEENDVILCMEYHNRSYTNTCQSALELMQRVNSKHFLLYWQPNQFISVEENLKAAKRIAPYTVNIHVFNWKGDEKYPLALAKDTWKSYLKLFKTEGSLLLEFMPDNQINSLKTEALTLKELVK